MLAGQKKYAAAIDHLRRIARAHPQITVVRYQLGVLLSRTGRLPEAEAAFRAAALVEPDNPYIPAALAGVLVRAGQLDEARDRAALAVALAEHRDARARAAAYETAARVALAQDESAQAETLRGGRPARRSRPANDAVRPRPHAPRGGPFRGGAHGLRGGRRRRVAARTAAQRTALVSGRHARPARPPCRCRDAVPRGAAGLPAQHPRLFQPGDAVSRLESAGRRRRHARRADRGVAPRPRATTPRPGSGRLPASPSAPPRSGPTHAPASAAIRLSSCFNAAADPFRGQASAGTARRAAPWHAARRAAESDRRVHGRRSPLRRGQLLQDRSAARLPRHQPRRHSSRAAGQRAQLSQEPALRQTAGAARQRPADQRGRLLAAPAPHRAAGVSSPAHRGAGRCDGRCGTGCRRALGNDCRQRGGRSMSTTR